MNTATHERYFSPVKSIDRVGIVGAEGIGIGIALALLDADIPVTMFDKPDALERALALLRAQVGQAVARGAMDAAKGERCLALFSATQRFHHLKDADLVLEVLPCENDARERFFRLLDEIGKPDAILAAHACGSRLDRIAGLTRRPADVLGLDFADPDDLSGRVKLVHGKAASAESAATVLALLGRIAKLDH